MTKIQRPDKNIVAFASQAQGNERTLFGSVSKSDSLDDNLNDDYERGWGILPLSQVPTKQDFNAALYTQSQLLAYIFQNGLPEWNDKQEFNKDSVTLLNGKIYISQIDNNVGNNPEEDSNSWYSQDISNLLDKDLSTISDAGKQAITSLIDTEIGNKANKDLSNVSQEDIVAKGIFSFTDMQAVISARNGAFIAPEGGSWKLLYLYKYNEATGTGSGIGDAINSVMQVYAGSSVVLSPAGASIVWSGVFGRVA